MMKVKNIKTYAMIVISLLIVVAVVSHVGPYNGSSRIQDNSIHYSDHGLKENDYVERGPIYIDGNDDFEAQAAAEGWPGDGTEDDPYVIEGYRIDGGDESSIHITDTEVYFIVRGNMIEGGNPWGITTSLTPNGNIIGNTIIGADRGIRVHSSDYITIENNFVSSSESTGLELSASVGTMINNNTLVNNQGGFFAMNSDENILMDNNIYDNERRGIGLYYCNYNVMSGNKLSGHETYGIEFYASAGNIVDNNIIFDNDLAGIHVDVEPGGGSSSRDNVIYNNNFIENGQHVINRGDNHYYNESKSLGNYWSDYEEKYPDAQELNGIWDTPYEGEEVVPFTDEHPQVDPGIPYINIVHPEDGEVIDEPDLTVSWSGRYRYEEQLEYEVRLNDEPWENVGVDTDFDITFSEPGEHRFEVRVTNVLTEQVGGIVDFTVDIESEILVSGFTVEPLDGFEPLEVSITADLENVGDADGETTLYIGDIETRTFTVPAGESVEVNESYVFDEAGDYTIELGDESAVVTVRPSEAHIQVSNFTVEPLDGIEPLEVSITADLENVGGTDGEITLYIGGIETSTFTVPAGETVEVDESYVFDEVGEYTVDLGDESAVVTVRPSAADIRVSDFTVEPLDGVEPLEVSITADLENVGGTNGVTTLFIDEREIIITVHAGESVEVDLIHVFEEAGNYTIELDDESAEVTVRRSAADIQVSNFTVEPLDGVEPLEVNITADIENVGGTDGEIILYLGDIETRTFTVPAGETVEVNESYVFEEAGNYTIELGDESAAITVSHGEADIQVSDFTVEPLDGVEPLEVSITANLENVGDADGEITLYIGDIETRTFTVPAGETVEIDESYVFEEAGDYTIELGDESSVISVDEKQDESGFNTTLLLIVVVLIGAVILVLIWLYYIRPKQEDQE